MKAKEMNEINTVRMLNPSQEKGIEGQKGERYSENTGEYHNGKDGNKNAYVCDEQGRIPRSDWNHHQRRNGSHNYSGQETLEGVNATSNKRAQTKESKFDEKNGSDCRRENPKNNQKRNIRNYQHSQSSATKRGEDNHGDNFKIPFSVDERNRQGGYNLPPRRYQSNHGRRGLNGRSPPPRQNWSSRGRPRFREGSNHYRDHSFHRHKEFDNRPDDSWSTRSHGRCFSGDRNMDWHSSYGNSNRSINHRGYPIQNHHREGQYSSKSHHHSRHPYSHSRGEQCNAENRHHHSGRKKVFSHRWDKRNSKATRQEE
mmetsp:Transcript_294/g.390  ORF Transcript_294/g.390 Transcript_294/m.390 type:complete len:313 (-) Transcript_294:673-1611(-)